MAPCYTTADRPLLMGGVNYIQLNESTIDRLVEASVQCQNDIQPKYPISASVITVGSGEASFLCRMSTNAAIVSHLPQLKMKLSQKFIVSRLCDVFPPY